MPQLSAKIAHATLAAGLASSLLLAPLPASAGPMDTLRCIPRRLGELLPWTRAHKDKVANDALADALTPARNYKTFPMHPMYVGEQKPGLKFNGVDYHVQYFTPAQLKGHRVTLNADGLLVDGEKNLVNTNNTPAIFIMTPKGQIYLSTELSIGKIHHSSLSGGQPVAAAGEMHVENGVITSVSSASGHYKPPDLALEQVAEELALRKYNISTIAFRSDRSKSDLAIPHLWPNPDLVKPKVHGAIRGEPLMGLLKSGYWKGIHLNDQVSVIDFPGAMIGKILGEVMGGPSTKKSFTIHGPVRDLKRTAEGWVAEVELASGARQSIPLSGRYNAPKFFLSEAEASFTSIKPTSRLPAGLLVGTRRSANRVHLIEEVHKARGMIREKSPQNWQHLFPAPGSRAARDLERGAFNHHPIYGVTVQGDSVTLFAGTVQRASENAAREIELEIIDTFGRPQTIRLNSESPEVFVSP